MKRNQIKAIAIDLDGTLLDSRQRISPYTIKVLQECRQRGIKLVIATGRNHYSARRLARDLEPVSFVTNNGSLVVDEKGEILREKEISLQLTRELIVKSQKIGRIYYFLVSPKELLLPPTPRSLILPLFRHLFTWKGFLEYLDNRNIVPRVRTRDVEGYLRKNSFQIQKINFIGEPSRIARLEGEIEEHNLAITRGHEWSIDVNPPGVNKGEALKFLTEQWGIGEDCFMAFGDGHNDLDMIRFAGTGVAMDNSTLKTLKESADLVAPSNNEDGVARIIEKIVLAES